MPIPEPPFTGEALLAAVTDAMVALHRRYHHREPLSARSMLMSGELLACVMGGVYTDVEKAMIELQRHAIVQETRSAFQEAMQDRFIGEGIEVGHDGGPLARILGVGARVASRRWWATAIWASRSRWPMTRARSPGGGSAPGRRWSARRTRPP